MPPVRAMSSNGPPPTWARRRGDAHDGGVEPLPDLLVELLGIVRARTEFGLVMATRVVDDDWQVVAVTENPYGVAAGDVFRWSDSICSRMVGRPDPEWLLADVEADGEAAVAPVRERLEIRSYAGSPIRGHDGEVIGTLCAIDPGSRTPEREGDLFAFAGRFAAHAIVAAAESVRQQREAERAPFRTEPGQPAVMPGSAWPGLLAAESERCRWSGDRLAVGLVRLVDGTGGHRANLEQLVGRLRAVLRPDEVVALLGSNRIGVLAHGRTDAELRAALDEAGAAAGLAVGVAVSEVKGPDAEAATAAEALEAELVGAPAAAARSTSQLLRYEFCAACGKKGRYRSAAANVERCKYCGTLTPPPS